MGNLTLASEPIFFPIFPNCLALKSIPHSLAIYKSRSGHVYVMRDIPADIRSLSAWRCLVFTKTRQQNISVAVEDILNFL